MVELRVDGLQELNEYFRQFERKLSNFQPFLRNEATSLLKNQIRDTFLNEGYGEWPPRRSGGSHPLLRKAVVILEMPHNVLLLEQLKIL